METMSRTVSENSKIRGNSLPEIHQAWKQLTLDLAGDYEVQLAARGSLREGNLLNAMVLWCLSRGDEERRELAIWGLKALETLKDRDEPLDLRRLSAEDFGSLGGIPDQRGAGESNGRRGGEPAPPRRRSKRTG
jgi:hypothetical protein